MKALSLEISHTKWSTKGCTIESRKMQNTGLDVLWRNKEGRLQSGESKGIHFAWNMFMWIFHCSFSFLSHMLQILIPSGHPSTQNIGVSTTSVRGCSSAVTSTNQMPSAFPFPTLMSMAGSYATWPMNSSWMLQAYVENTCISSYRIAGCMVSVPEIKLKT